MHFIEGKEKGFNCLGNIFIYSFVLQRVVKTTLSIICIHLQSIHDISEVRCLNRTQRY